MCIYYIGDIVIAIYFVFEFMILYSISCILSLFL